MKPITQDEFYTLTAGKYPAKPDHATRLLMAKYDIRPPRRQDEREWWQDGPLIGLVIEDMHDHDWNYVILGPDPAGDLRGIDQGVSLASQEVAHSQLHSRMAQITATGQTVFVQD